MRRSLFFILRLYFLIDKYRQIYDIFFYVFNFCPVSFDLVFLFDSVFTCVK